VTSYRAPAESESYAGARRVEASGVVRDVYYAKIRQGQIWMLTIHAKNVTESIPSHVMKKIKEEIDG
jgi:hypothetical protein